MTPAPAELHLWRLDAGPDEAARLARHLSPEEEDRALRFRRPGDGAAYRTGRGRMREILAGHMGTLPGALRFETGPQGKPRLRGGPEFNLSHSGGLACLAVHPAIPLGVDIEAIRQIEATELADRFFAPEEARGLSALPPVHRLEGFFRCWTRKEAMMKAIGTGLSLPLDSFAVSFAPGEAPRLTRMAPGHGVPSDWRLVHLDLGAGVVGALAARTAGAPLPLVLGSRPEGLDLHWSG